MAVVWRPAGGKESTPRTAAGPPTEVSPEALEALVERRARQERQKGYAEGEAAGRSAAEQELGPVLDRLARSIEELARLRPVLAARAEADLLKLSIAIARRILHRELSIDPDALAGIVSAALDKVRLEEVSRVRVHPEHAAVLRAAFEKSARPVRVEPDASLEKGGVVVETGHGKLDASVDTQLAEIERGLADRLRRHA